MTCCIPYNLGCVNICNDIELLVAPESGIYLFEFMLFGVTIKKEIEATENEPFKLNLNDLQLNESTCIEFKIYKENELIEFEIDNEQYSCFEIKTTL